MNSSTLRAPLGAFAAAALLLPAEPAQLLPQYTEGLGLFCEATTLTEMELTSFERIIDGEPVEGQGSPVGQKSSEKRTVVFDSTFSKVSEEGVPTTETRAYFEGLQVTTMTMGDEERETELESPFVGVTVLLQDSESGMEIEVLEGDEPEDETLLDAGRFRMTTVLDGLLPEAGEELEEGAAWELDSEAIQVALGLTDSGLLFPPAPRGERGGERGGEGGGGGRRGGGRRGRGGAATFLGSAEWTGKATFVGIDDEGIATVEILFETSGDIPEPERPEGGRGRRGGGDRSFVPALAMPVSAPLVAGSFQAELEGQLHFDTALNLPVLLEVEGALSTEQSRDFDRGERSMSMSSSQEGRLERSVKISKVEDHKESSDEDKSEE